MPVYQLSDRIVFPPPELSEEDGLLAVGGDLCPERLLQAYRQGIFPWYSSEEPILWWSPDPRLVLYPDELHVSRSLEKILRQGVFTVTLNRNFRDVITECAQIYRMGQNGTWITSEMIDAYCTLHEMGFAHSVEVWQDGELAGGLYGVSVGGCFCGESMFARKSNASKVGFVTMVRWMQKHSLRLIDCQVTTRHLVYMGAREIPRRQFLSELADALKLPAPDFHHH